MLLVRGEIEIPLFFLFLLVASRLYAPLEGALQNLAAVISTKTNIDRMNEILDQPIQTGSEQLTNKGYDIVFDHVGFAYQYRGNCIEGCVFYGKAGGGYRSGWAVRRRKNNRFPPCRAFLGY